jgi:plastocyanin
MRTLLTCLLAATLPLSVAACGGGDSGGSKKQATFAKTDTVGVSGTEYHFDPGDITVTGGGGAVTFKFSNDGSQAHNLEIEKGDERVAGSNTFQGGRSETFKADLTPGSYDLICSVGDHANRGMKGKLTVK